jgi:hypothetical protein
MDGGHNGERRNMKGRLLCAAILVACAALLSTAKPANAAVHWPANCRTIACVNDHMNALKAQADGLRKVVANLNAFNKCLTLVPVTEYPYYLANDGVSSVPALDVTATGDPISVWMPAIVAGDCGAPTVLKPATSRTSIGLSGYNYPIWGSRFAR